MNANLKKKYAPAALVQHTRQQLRTETVCLVEVFEAHYEAHPPLGKLKMSVLSPSRDNLDWDS
jgi:hypothetical protein